jgi:hypothetical protein
MGNQIDTFSKKLERVSYSGFFPYVLQILDAIGAPGITISKIEKKYRDSPTKPIQYFDRAAFIHQLGPVDDASAQPTALGLQKTPLLVFTISESVVQLKNTQSGERVRFHPNEIASHVLSLLPLVQGSRGITTHQETWLLAELVTILKNDLVEILEEKGHRGAVPRFLLELLKASISNFFLGNPKVAADLILDDNQNLTRKIEKYSEHISSSLYGDPDAGTFMNRVLSLADRKTIKLIEKVFLYDFGQVDSEIIGSLIYRVVDDQAGSRSHMVSDDNALKIIGPTLVEPYLLELARLDAGTKEYETLARKISELTFLDPTNGTGNLLATAINRIAAYTSLPGELNQRPDRVNPENFVSINQDPVAASVTRMVLWFSFLKHSYHPGNVTVQDLMTVYRNVRVIEANPLESSWAVARNGGLPDLIVGVPTFKGWHKLSDEEKALFVRSAGMMNVSNLDFSAAWMIKAVELIAGTTSQACFGLTNSLVQGRQVQLLWPSIFSKGIEIAFAYPSFRWINDTKQNTGVSAVIIGIRTAGAIGGLPTLRQNGKVRRVKFIGPYLVEDMATIVESRSKRAADSQLPPMAKGNMPYDNGQLLLTLDEKNDLLEFEPSAERFIKRIVGSDEFINAIERFCIWIPTELLDEALEIKPIAQRIAAVRDFRLSSVDAGGKKLSQRAHQFREFRSTIKQTLVVPSVSSENRRFIPMGFVGPETIVSNLSFAVYESPAWVLPILASSMHMVWASTTCGNLETRIRYSSHLCYNTFPLPTLGQNEISALTDRAFQLVACREEFPDRSLGALYSNMPNRLERQHLLNDEYVDNLYGLHGVTTDQDRLQKMLQLYRI